jgi:hypothetical protein
MAADEVGGVVITCCLPAWADDDIAAGAPDHRAG